MTLFRKIIRFFFEVVFFGRFFFIFVSRKGGVV